LIIIELSIRGALKLKPKNQEEVERDKKYASFCKTDFHLIRRWGFYLTAPFFIPRVILGWGAAFTNGIFFTVFCFIHGDSNKPFNDFEKWIIRVSTCITG